MADDGVIRIGTQVDISGIKAGMTEAEATIKTSTSNMAAAYQKLGAATIVYADAQKGLQQTIKLLGASEAERAIAIKTMPSIMQANTEASNALKAARAELASVTTMETQTEKEETQALRTNISARMAASAELRVFEGNMMGSTRAAGAFLTMLPGMSVMMQSAFSVFGAVALGMVIVDVGKKLYEAFDMGGERARKMAEDIIADSVSMRALNDSLDVELDKLEMANAKLEHKPITNAMQLAIDQAAEAADRLYEKLGNDLKRIEETVKGMAGSEAQQFIGSKSGTGYEQTMLEQHSKWLAEAKTEQDQLNESTSYGLSLQTRLNELSAMNEKGGPGKWRVAPDGSGWREYFDVQTNGWKRVAMNSSDAAQTEIDATQHMIAMQGQEQRAIKATIDIEAEQGKHDTLVAAHEDQSDANRAAAAERKAQEEKIRADREALDAAKSTHAMTAAEESGFWANIAALAKFGSLEYTTAVDEANKATARVWNENKTLASQVSNQLYETWKEGQKAADEYTKKQDELSLAIAESTARIQEAHDKANESLDLANVKYAELTGGMTKLNAAYETARIHAEAYRKELERLDEEITKVNEDESLSPEQKAQKNGQLQAQKIQLQGQATTTGVQDQAAITQQIEQPYLTAFNNINQAWLQVQDKLFYSTRNIGLEFAKMGQSILVSFVNMGEQVVLKAAEHDLLMLLHRQITNTAMTASDAQQAAASEGIQNASQLKKLALELIGLFHHTATNAAKTTSDVATNTASVSADATAAATKTSLDAAAASAHVAIVASSIAANTAAAQSFAGLAAVEAAAAAAPGGPIAAIVAGATMYGAMAPFVAMASLDIGTGYVPRDGLAAIHQGEIIVPAPTADELRNGTGSEALTINQHNNWNTMTDREFQRQLERHASHVANAVRKHMRQGGR